jgi:hypothetical protein
MEGLEFPAIFTPTGPAVTRDFFDDQGWSENNLTVLDGLHREDYSRKVIMTTGFFKWSASYRHMKLSYGTKGIMKKYFIKFFQGLIDFSPNDSPCFFTGSNWDLTFVPEERLWKEES